MTRQKKEILRKIDEINGVIEVEEELGCGFVPDGWYDPLHEAIRKLEDELAHLRHYENAMTMRMDTRGIPGYSGVIPFQVSSC